ncbi:MAG TPA: HAMP domain-containing sensor histidine kinase [Lichenihabitans sp.]|nr:HAMP domain-containing sensor histidine kinase [Lichenihabitans sp.]
MPWTELLRTTAFRWTFGLAAVLAMSILLMAGFFYWQTVVYLTGRIDTSLLSDVTHFAEVDQAEMPARLTAALASDPRRRKAYGLFDREGHRLAGNLPYQPSPLPPDGRVAQMKVMSDRQNQNGTITVRAAAVRLDNGNLLFMGRIADELQEIEDIVTRAMLLAILPAVVIALLGGALVSKSALRRVEAVRRACLSIMEGHLERRLPVRSKQDEFDRLSEIVNRMLDDIERLIAEARGAGDAVAHDVRTPLTRLRVRLERALRSDLPPAEVAPMLEKAIVDIDALLTTVTAILRITEVEQSRRRSNFGSMDLDEIVEAVSELYRPIAEEKGVGFVVEREPAPGVNGDADLVFEALANLVDNAIKFTPPQGRVTLSLGRSGEEASVAVLDTGPGIPVEDRQAVLRRFYRGDSSRSKPGTGLGLSLVAAIVRLHGFTLTLGEAPGGGCAAVIAAKAEGIAPS